MVKEGRVDWEKLRDVAWKAVHFLDNVIAVIFFNNVGCLGMCGHGTIGLVTTLAWLGRIAPGAHRIETPVGVVDTRLEPSGEVSVRNVPAWRHRAGVRVDVPGHGPVTGDVAWGGNWFFLVSDHGQRLELGNAGRLTDFTWRIRHALERDGITGADGAVIDHIELFVPDTGERRVLHRGGSYGRYVATGDSGYIVYANASSLFAIPFLKPMRPSRN